MPREITSTVPDFRLPQCDTEALLQVVSTVDVDPYTDFTAFRVFAQQAWTSLSEETRKVVTGFSDRSGGAPMLYLHGLPVDQHLSATPTKVAAVRSTQGVLSELIMICLSVGLGPPISYAQEHGGRIFHDVFPTPGNAAALSSQSSSAKLGFHTEMAFHPDVPAFLLLHCLRPDPDGSASTLVADATAMWRGLSDRAQRALSEPAFALELSRLHSPYTQDGRPIGPQDDRPCVPLFTAESNSVTLRFEPELMHSDVPACDAALHQAEALATELSVSVNLETGGLLLIDNTRAAHARSAFSARFDGSDRWLRRVMISQLPTPKAGFVSHNEAELARTWRTRGAPFTGACLLRAPAEESAR